ncbi:MAG: hypothetical protein PHS14_20845 [Elusimicrobia bacterium]|nr:hypothetical protein [Elusimicrobiota bacterium]
MSAPASGARTLLGLKIDRQIPGQQLGCPEPVISAIAAPDPPGADIGADASLLSTAPVGTPAGPAATGTGTYTGVGAAIFDVEIDATGSPDTFKWRKNGGSWTTGVATLDASPILLSDGISVTFTTPGTFGHTLGDAWTITWTPGGVTGASVLYKMSAIYAGLGEGAASAASTTIAPTEKAITVTPAAAPTPNGAVVLGRRFYRKIDSGPYLEIKTRWDNTTDPFTDSIMPGAEGVRTPRSGTTGMSAEQTGANFGFQFIRVDNASDFNRDDTYFKSTEQTGRLGEPRGIPGLVKYTHAFNFDVRIGSLVPLLASMMGKPTVTQSTGEPVLTYAFPLSDLSSDSISLSALFYKGGDFRPQLFLGMKCSEIAFDLGKKQAQAKAKLEGQHDTECGFGKALSGNTGTFASAPVVRGVRSDAKAYSDSVFVKVIAAPAVSGGIGSFTIKAALAAAGTVSPSFGDAITKSVKTTTGHDDLTGAGTYTGSVMATYEVEIDATGSPDTYKWRKNGGAYTTGVNATTGPVVLSDGITVTFGSATGHSVGDKWVVFVAISNVYYDPTTKRQIHPAAIGNATGTAQQSAWVELWESTTGLALGFDEEENRKPFEVYFPGDVTLLAANDIFEIPALLPVPDVYTAAHPTGPGDDGSYTGQRPRFTFTSRMTPAHVTLFRGPSSTGQQVLNAISGTMKIGRPIDAVEGLGPEAANPIDVDVFGKFVLGLDIDRRYVTREFERAAKADERFYSVVQVQSHRVVVDPVYGTLSALREQANFTYAQARVDKTAAVLSGDKVIDEKITITPEQPDDDTLEFVDINLKTAHSWDFSRV